MVELILLFVMSFMSVDRTERIQEVDAVVVADGIIDWVNRRPQVWCRQVILLKFEDGEYKSVGSRYVVDNNVPEIKEGYYVFTIYVYPGVRKYKTKKVWYMQHDNNDQEILRKRFPDTKQRWFL